jgi:hypothetical protein
MDEYDDLDFLFDWEEDFEIDSMENTNDEPDNCAQDLSDDEEESRDAIHLTNTRFLKNNLIGHNITNKVKAILHFMDSQNMNLPIFLDALSWGDQGCHSDSKIQYARTALLVSDELPGILDRWYNPPRARIHKKGKRPAGARQSLRAFATHCVGTCVDKEMKSSAHLFLSPPEELSEEHLTSFDFNQMFNVQPLFSGKFFAERLTVPSKSFGISTKILTWCVVTCATCLKHTVLNLY